MQDLLAISIESPAFEDGTVHVASLTGQEVIGQTFSFELRVVTRHEAPLDVEALRGGPVAIVFHRGDDEVRRIWGAVVEVAEDLQPEGDYRPYRLAIAPRAHRMRLVHTQDILLDTSWPAAIEEKVGRVGLADALEMRLHGDYEPREFIIQYDETDLAFVSRLAEHIGISFFFEHDDEADRIVFTDHNEGFASLDEPIPFRHFSEHRDVFALEAVSRVVPTNVVMQEYNYRTPTVDLTASTTVASGAGGGVVEYGAHYKTLAEGEAMARLRAEEIHAHQLVYHGKSSRPELSAGLRIEIADNPILADPKLLVIAVHHHARQNAMGQGGDEPNHYENRFEAIPVDRPYRPRRLTPRPRLAGYYVGLVQPSDDHVVGPSAELDTEGRYRVRMLFDIKPRDGWVSRPVRMAQPHSGAGHGMHFPLRPGVEVVIVFANGDPDRPIIVGALDNPVTPSPTVQKNSRQNIISTASGITITLRDNR